MPFRYESPKYLSESQSPLDSPGVKRAVDIIGALCALIVFFPVVLCCIVAILLTGSRQIIYRQTRLGILGKDFKILKLSTMKCDAHLTGPLVSSGTDSRTTQVGKVLRAMNLNELPQFLNVLKGDMSLVGPRPEVSKFLSGCSPEDREKLFSVRPGLTGLSKLRFWNEAALLEDADDIEQAYMAKIVPVKLQTDVWYAVHRTFWLDLRIIGVTLIRFLTGSRSFSKVLSFAHLPDQEEQL